MPAIANRNGESGMEFEWDMPKAAENVRKHGVTFDEAASVIFDPFAITTADVEHSRNEWRERTIGPSSKHRILIVVHTERSGKTLRIISARKADRQEATDYEEEVKRRLAGQG